MTKKIFRSFFGLTTLVMVLGMTFLSMVLYNYFNRSEFSQLKIQTDLAVQGLELNGQGFLNGLQTDGYRLTLIDADGTVKYDSAEDASDMENHSGRKEIRDALQNGTGESRRYSATLSEETFYYARKLSNGMILRISVTQNSVMTPWKMIGYLLAILAAAMVLSMLIARKVSRSIVKPINELDLDNPLENDTYDEIAPLLTRMEAQRKDILEREMELGKRQSEFSSLTRNMSEGMILLDEQGLVLSMNNSARRLFHVSGDPVGTDFLIINHSLPMQKLMERAQKDGHAEEELEAENGTYRFLATPVNSGGMVMLTMNITDQAEAEKMRREFTANVSHELKTPLQSIMGTAELIQNGLVKQEDIPDFMERMHKELSRMVVLINDIMQLSELDEGHAKQEKQNADLSEIAEDAVKNLNERAEKYSVTVTTDLKSAHVFGSSRLFSETVLNLIDNAIKYNKQNGSVDVKTFTENGAAVLVVKDSGLGIPEEDQKHVFERFYRVDKSRSKEKGGTGLGLSIVKHAVQVNGGEISMNSKEGEGTTVTVRFPEA